MNMLKFLSKKKQEYPTEEDIRKDFSLEYEASQLVLKFCINEGISEKFLYFYDRYYLEVSFININSIRLFGLNCWITVYNKDFDKVYDLKSRCGSVGAPSSKEVNKILWELRYWLSLDWKEEL